MSNIFDLFKKIESEREASHGAIEWIVCGLGNPGDKYAKNRHNAGFMFIDYISQKYNTRVDRLKFKALCGEAVIGNTRVLLMKPQTFMNASGEALREAVNFYKIPPERVLVICDDVNFEPGKLRIRRSGSAGGQNGVKSIIENLSSDVFPRIKLGVGKKPRADYPLADWVLGNIPKEEQEAMFEALTKAADACALIISGNFDRAMNLYN